MRFRTTTVVALSLLMVFGLAVGVPSVLDGQEIIVENAAADHCNPLDPNPPCCMHPPLEKLCFK